MNRLVRLCEISTHGCAASRPLCPRAARILFDRQLGCIADLRTIRNSARDDDLFDLGQEMARQHDELRRIGTDHLVLRPVHLDTLHAVPVGALAVEHDGASVGSVLVRVVANRAHSRSGTAPRSAPYVRDGRYIGCRLPARSSVRCRGGAGEGRRPGRSGGRGDVAALERSSSSPSRSDWDALRRRPSSSNASCARATARSPSRTRAPVIPRIRRRSAWPTSPRRRRCWRRSPSRACHAGRRRERRRGPVHRVLEHAGRGAVVLGVANSTASARPGDQKCCTASARQGLPARRETAERDEPVVDVHWIPSEPAPGAARRSWLSRDWDAGCRRLPAPALRSRLDERELAISETVSSTRNPPPGSGAFQSTPSSSISPSSSSPIRSLPQGSVAGSDSR